MTLSRIVAILICSIFSINAVAQNQPKIKIGTNGIPHGINEIGIAEAITVESFTKDGVLHITKENKAYTIESFEISILPPTGKDILGPLAINSSRAAGSIGNLNSMPEIKNHLQDGTRIFIEKLTASCVDCADMNTITVKAFSIKLK